MQQTHLGKLAGLVTRRHPRELLNERPLAAEVRERMAAELDRAVDCVALEALVQAGKVSGEEQSLADQVLDGSAGSDRILVIADEGGLMGRLKYQLPDSHLSEVIVRLHNYNGVAVVVTSEESVGLPKWARMFHERVATAGTLDEEARLRCWERALGERVSLSADLDLAVVAREFVLSIAEIEAAAVRAALLVAAGDSGGELGLEAVVEAVEGVGEEGGGVPLFGELQDSGPSRWGWPPEMATFPLPAVSCGIGTPSGRALAGPESQMGRLMQCSRANREIGEWDSEIERRHDSRK